MKVAIVGLPKSGKTTIFNALTRSKAGVTAYSSSLVPNIGIAKVPDPRLKALEDIFHPQKTVPAEISYVDIAALPRSSAGGGKIEGELLNYLTTADTLLQVVRAFQDANLPHPEGSIDPRRDIANLDLELAFSDLTIIERRLDKLGSALKGAKSVERELYLKEQRLLHKVKSGLEQDIPLRQQDITKEENKLLSPYQFLTAKPMLVIANIGEEQLPQTAAIEGEISTAYPKFPVIALCGKLEMELGELSEGESKEFRESMGIAKPALDRVIALSYRLLGLISFFTTVSDELKAWTIPGGTEARKAAGKVHSDMERGFIRAEVISYDDLSKCGSLAEGRKRGLLRIEGKDYIIQDGDIATFLFNV
jgi:hypothetical protein